MFNRNKAIAYPIREINDMPEWKQEYDALGNKTTHPYSMMMAGSRESKKLLKAVLPVAKARIKKMKKEGKLEPTLIYRDGAVMNMDKTTKPVGIAMFMEGGEFTIEVHTKGGGVMSGKMADEGRTVDFDFVVDFVSTTLKQQESPIWNLGEDFTKWPKEIYAVMENHADIFANMVHDHDGEMNAEAFAHYSQESCKIPVQQLKDLGVDIARFFNLYIDVFFATIHNTPDEMLERNEERKAQFLKERTSECEQ